MRHWFTSDLHFFHKNIIGFCNRPWASVEAMNAGLVERINARVKPGDQLYILGDLSFGRTTETCQLLAALPGQLHWILGNHDPKTPNERYQRMFASMSTYKEVKVGKRKICMSHYPMESWHKQHWGSYMLHGHCHGTLKRQVANRVDVGVDAGWDWMPCSIEELEAHPNMNMTVEQVDHHKEGDL